MDRWGSTREDKRSSGFIVGKPRSHLLGVSIRAGNVADKGVEGSIVRAKMAILLQILAEVVGADVPGHLFKQEGLSKQGALASMSSSTYIITLFFWHVMC